jgi:hypothetical protein
VSPDPVIVLEDASDGAARTTGTLLASLVVRVRTLALLSGSQAVGSLVAGAAELGRQVSASAEGARIRSALERTRPGINAEALWSTLGLGDLASILPPTPVLEDLRNDIALLVAPDLDQALVELDEGSVSSGIGLVREPRPVGVLDFLVGLWALARFLGDAVELLAEPAPPEATPDEPAEVIRADDGPILR